MKKFLLTALILCMGVSFTACDSSSSPKKEAYSENQTSGKETAKSGDEVFSINETAVFKNLKITATEIKNDAGNDFFKPESGNTFVGIKFVVENTSEETQSVSSLLLFDAYADDIKCDYSISANCVFDDGTLDGEISAGKKLVGWYALEVPADCKTIELEVKDSWLSDNKAKFVFER